MPTSLVRWHWEGTLVWLHWSSEKHSFGSHFDYDWWNCQPESSRNHHCQAYILTSLQNSCNNLAKVATVLQGLLCGVFVICSSKPWLLWRVVDANWWCWSANQKHGHSFHRWMWKILKWHQPIVSRGVICTQSALLRHYGTMGTILCWMPCIQH